MKYVKRIFPLIIFGMLGVYLSSCCESNGSINSEEGVRLMIHSDYSGTYDHSYSIRKIELVEAKKTIEYGSYYYNSPQITLNPSDTVCTFRIFYDDYYNPDSAWVGMLKLKYTASPEYLDDGCERKMLMTYDVKVDSSSFSVAKIGSYGYYDNESTIEITP